jgi:hypothetical protein
MHSFSIDMSSDFAAHKNLSGRLPSPLFRPSAAGKDTVDKASGPGRETKAGEKVSNEHRNAIVKVLSMNGPPTVCAWCKRLRNYNGRWTAMKISIDRHPDILFTHGICPECFEKCTAELEMPDRR